PLPTLHPFPTRRSSDLLGNGSPALVPRHPNFLWEQLAADELTASLIVDGHHLSASVVKVMVRAKGAARIALVTDATAAAAQPAGDRKSTRLNSSHVAIS